MSRYNPNNNKGKQYYDKYYLCKELHDLSNKFTKQHITKEKENPMAILIRFIRLPYEINAELGDWIDLRASKTVELKAGDFAIIPLGVAMKLPTGYEAHLAPRSSTFKNWGVLQTNGVGVIDNSYSGDDDEWGMPVYATRDTTIRQGDRICQFRIMKKMGTVTIREVEHLDSTNRGGFGSTGTN